MKIGDKVRLLRGTEEGLIVNIRKNKFVDIEIEDGFVIPALINEVVVIDQSESISFDLPKPKKKSSKSMDSHDPIGKGLFLAFSPVAEKQFEGYIINHTQHTALFVISQYDKKNVLGKKYGICHAGQHEEIGIYTENIYNPKYQINVQTIQYEENSKLKSPPIDKNITVSKQQMAKTIFWNEQEKTISLIALSGNTQMSVDADALKNSLLEKKESPAIKKSIRTKDQMTVDLHFDPDEKNLPENQILNYQLQQFERAYDEALLSNVTSLKVIHGAGAGILRKEIHKLLSTKAELKYFEDADKERFGFGATIIYF